jgi:toxin ParE1/3/4
MAAKLLWTPKAVLTLRRSKSTSQMLIEHPRLGERHPEVFRTARMLVEAPYVILYETKPDSEDRPIHTVEIVRVVDGRRDLSALL